MKKFFPILKIISLTYVIFCATAVVKSCSDKPVANTPEYLSAHGLQEGKDNKILIANTLFNIPKGQNFRVYSTGKITPGKADQLSLEFNYHSFYPDEYKKYGDNYIDSTFAVHVDIQHGGQELFFNKEYNADDKQWVIVRLRKDLNLMEYINKIPDNGFGFSYLQSIDNSERTPRGNRIQFRCTTRPNNELSICESSYQHQKGFVVSYRIVATLMYKWHEIHLDVENKINTYTEHNND